jgi:nitroreductase
MERTALFWLPNRAPHHPAGRDTIVSDGHPLLPLSLDELLTTTRAVRNRLDLTRPVERGVIEECLRIAQQAPSASNRQHWHFVVVTDSAKRAALAEVYRKGRQTMLAGRLAEAASADERAEVEQRIAAGDSFGEKLADVPVHVIPCIEGRAEAMPQAGQAALWGTIAPAAWNFVLAARARGLGTVWTTIHLYHEPDAAEILGIPYDRVMQAALFPLAYTVGTQFKPSRRNPLETMVHWDRW